MNPLLDDSVFAAFVWLSSTVVSIVLHTTGIVQWMRAMRVAHALHDHLVHVAAWQNCRGEIILLLIQIVYLFLGGTLVFRILVQPVTINLVSWLLIMTNVLLAVKSVLNRRDINYIAQQNEIKIA